MCERPPAERIPPLERLRFAEDPPDRIVLWTQCRGRGCGTVYAITARAYQEATPECDAA